MLNGWHINFIVIEVFFFFFLQISQAELEVATDWLKLKKLRKKGTKNVKSHKRYEWNMGNIFQIQMLVFIVLHTTN